MPQRFELITPTWKGYIESEGPLVVIRPSVPIALVYGRVVETDGAGNFVKEQFEQISRLEATGGMTVPFYIEEDGTATIGLRSQTRWVIRDSEAFDRAQALYKQELEEAFGKDAGKKLLALNVEVLDARRMHATTDQGPETETERHWPETKAEFERINNRLAARLSEIGFGRESWEIPGGYGRPGETGLQASKRQFLEETDPNTVVASWSALGEVVANRGHEIHMVRLCAAKVDPSRTAADPANVDARANIKPDPFDAYGKLTRFDRASLRQLRKEGTLFCSLTEAAIARYRDASEEDPSRFPPLR